jgi:hypothetical protein
MVIGLRSCGVAGKQRSILAGRINAKFPYIAAALNSLPDDTVVDGEVVAIGPDGQLLKGQAVTDLTITVEDAQSHLSVRTLKRSPISERTKFRHIEGATFVLRADGIAVLTVIEFEGWRLLTAQQNPRSSKCQVRLSTPPHETPDGHG